MFLCTLNRQKLRKRCRREGRYMLRTNLTENDPALLWRYYMPLVAVEQAFKNLKGIWRSVLSSIKTSVGLRLISSSRSWPTACRSRSSAAFMPADSDEASHRFRPKPATCSD
jgi:hypothetical protein